MACATIAARVATGYRPPRGLPVDRYPRPVARLTPLLAASCATDTMAPLAAAHASALGHDVDRFDGSSGGSSFVVARQPRSINCCTTKPAAIAEPDAAAIQPSFRASARFFR